MVGVTTAFDAACRILSPSLLTVSMGAVTLRIRVAGPLLAKRLFDPVLHLAVPDCDVVDLRIDAWSSEESGIERAPDEPVVTVDADAGQAVFHFESATTLPRSVLARPFQKILMPLLHARGLAGIHAALIAPASHGPGLLLVGPNGSGKSTTTLSAVMHGFSMAGDDCVGIEQRGVDVIGHSFYRTCCVTEETRRAFAALPGPLVFPANADKRAKGVLTLEAKGTVQRAFPVNALIFPEIVSGTQTRSVDIHAGEAMRRFMPALRMAGSFVSEQRRSYYETLTSLVQRLPCFRLELGGDFAAAPPVLRDLAGALP